MKFLADIEVEEGLKDSSGGLGTNGQILSSTGSLTSWINTTATGNWTLSGNNIYNNNSANVGIGTTNPLRKLDLIADLSTDAVRIKNTNANGGGLSVFAANGGGGSNRILSLGDSSENVKVAVLESGNVGIGITTPTSKLHINQDVTNPDLDQPESFAVQIDSNHSGSDATTSDREQGGLFIDVDSSTTGGDAANEHRLYGIYNNVNHTGDADLVYGSSNTVEQNTTTGATSNVYAVNGTAISDGGTNATLTNLVGVYGATSMQDATPVNNSYGGLFFNNSISNRTGLTSQTYGVKSEIQIDSTSAFTNLYAGHFSIDSNTAYTATNSYLLYLDYAGTSLATNTYAIYSVDDVKSYHKGNFGINTNNPQYNLHVVGNARVTGAYYDSNNSPGSAGQVLSSTVTGTDWVTPTTGVTSFNTLTGAVSLSGGTGITIAQIGNTITVASSGGSSLWSTDTNGITYSGAVGVNIASSTLVDLRVGTGGFRSEGIIYSAGTLTIGGDLSASNGVGTAGQVLTSGGSGNGASFEDNFNSDTTGEPSGSDVMVNIVSLTQAEYDAGTPVSTTLYIIT